MLWAPSVPFLKALWLSYCCFGVSLGQLLASETDGDGISGLVDPLCVVQKSDRGLLFSITRSQHKIQDTLGLLPSPGSPTEETKARAPFSCLPCERIGMPHLFQIPGLEGLKTFLNFRLDSLEPGETLGPLQQTFILVSS